MSVFDFVGECTVLLHSAIIRIFKKPFERKELLDQINFIGAGSIPIVVLTTMFSGGVISLYSTEILVRYGASSLAGAAVGLAVTREIAPVLAGIMVAARCGSSMAAQIATMKVTEQIDALRVLRVHPVQYLVTPRLLAGLICLPILTLIGCYSGIIGGMLVAQLSGVPQESFMNSLKRFVIPWDVSGGMIKALFFGLILVLVGCQQGFAAKDGAVGVGRATTHTVVISMIFIYIANFILASLLY